MTPATRKLITIIIIAIAFMLLACDGSQVNHWDRNDGGTCYSTIQRGCLDALMGWE